MPDGTSPPTRTLDARKLQLGIVVADLDATVAQLERLLGVGPFRRMDVPAAGVRAAMADWAGVEIELLEATNDDVARSHRAFLKGRAARLQHVGAYVGDLDREAGQLRAGGARFLIEELASDDGRAALADLRDEAGFLLELVETARQARDA